MSVKLKHITPNLELTIEYMARISMDSQIKMTGVKEDAINFVKKLVKRKHLSMGRFAIAIFEVECSINCARQLVRHKHLDYIEMSRRYTKLETLPKEVNKINEYLMNQIVLPEALLKNNCLGEGGLLDEYLIDVYNDIKLYEKMLSQGVKPEDARSKLPGCMKTKIGIVGNLQGWRDFVLLRCNKSAQKEIRNIACEIRDILIKECEGFFGDLKNE